MALLFLHINNYLISKFIHPKQYDSVKVVMHESGCVSAHMLVYGITFSPLSSSFSHISKLASHVRMETNAICALPYTSETQILIWGVHVRKDSLAY